LQRIDFVPTRYREVVLTVSKLAIRMGKTKKARRFLPSAAPTIPTGGKGYSTSEIIEDSALGGNVRYRTICALEKQEKATLKILSVVRSLLPLD